VVTEFFSNHNGARQPHILRSRIQRNNHVNANRAVPIPNPNTLLTSTLLNNQVKMPRNTAKPLKRSILIINPKTFLLKVPHSQIHQTRPCLRFLSNAHAHSALFFPKQLSICIGKRLSEGKHEMAPTNIVKCPNCQGLMLATATQKTKTCPYCSKNVNLQKAQHVAKAQSAMEASEMLKQLKTKQASNPNPKKPA
jgi:hypothetical protein